MSTRSCICKIIICCYLCPKCSLFLNTRKHIGCHCKWNLPFSGRMVLKHRGNLKLWTQNWIPNSYIFRKETDCTIWVSFTDDILNSEAVLFPKMSHFFRCMSFWRNTEQLTGQSVLPRRGSSWPLQRSSKSFGETTCIVLLYCNCFLIRIFSAVPN